jgi:hypothetical protein
MNTGRAEADMVHIALSPETAALAERLAAAHGVSVEEAIRQAIEQCALAAGVTAKSRRQRGTSTEVTSGAGMESQDRARIALLERLRSEPVVDVGPWRRDELYEGTF